MILFSSMYHDFFLFSQLRHEHAELEMEMEKQKKQGEAQVSSLMHDKV